MVLGDRLHDIVNALCGLIGVRELVVLSGGLGPMVDDLTRNAVALALNLPLEESQQLRSHIETFLASINIAMRPIDLGQTSQMLPEDWRRWTETQFSQAGLSATRRRSIELTTPLNMLAL